MKTFGLIGTLVDGTQEFVGQPGNSTTIKAEMTAFCADPDVGQIYKRVEMFAISARDMFKRRKFKDAQVEIVEDDD